MKIHQLSVFLENKSGRLNEVLDTLGKANIRIVAATVADTSEFGILRLITSNPDEAYEALRAQRIGTNRSDVIAIKSDPLAGIFAANLKHFASANISIEYMYCFSMQQDAYLILKPNDIEAAQAVAQACGLTLVSNEQLLEL